MNAPKCQLIVKEPPKIKALRLFEGRAVEINDDCRVLGSVTEYRASLTLCAPFEDENRTTNELHA